MGLGHVPGRGRTPTKLKRYVMSVVSFAFGSNRENLECSSAS
jgi:hypothetical protein